MPVFNLESFPNVCRLCLKPESGGLYPISGNMERIQMPIETFLDEITFRMSEHKVHYLPKLVCDVCINQLTEFAVYRNRLMLTHRFMETLVDLKYSNSEPLKSLFRDSKDELDSLFNDLSLCNKTKPHAEDILREFESYNLANYKITVKEEIADQVEGEEGMCDEPDGDTLETKPDIYMCEVSHYKSDSNNSSSDDEKPLKKRKKPSKAKSAQSSSTGPRSRGRPKIYSDGIYLPEPWSCDKCKFTTKYRTAVDRHKAVHEKRENRSYPCPECELVFKTGEQLRAHVSSSHPSKNSVVCEVCGVSLSNAYSLRSHMERHGDTPKYSCEYCDYTTLTQISLKAHLLFHRSDTLNKHCEVCGLSFRTASRLKSHMEMHSNERKYPCQQCSGRFNTNNALRSHVTRVHLAVRYPCEHCDKTFDQKIALRDHTERVHQIQCTFICDICVATFDSQEKLNVHQLRHEDPKPLECRTCLAIYTTQEAFDGHLCITYREDYLCCNKDLRNHAQYNRHMLVKHGLQSNARVKPIPGVLLGQLRGARKRLEQCRKCDIAFPSRALKLQHMMECGQSSTSEVEYSNVEGNVPMKMGNY